MTHHNPSNPPSIFSQALSPLTSPLSLAWQRSRGVSRDYSLSKLRNDILAGVTVASVSVPQSMAYAIIAGVPPVYGLYSIIIQSLIAAPFSAHPLLSVGPMITQSILVASIVNRLEGSGDPATYLSLVITLTLLKGIMQLGMAMMRLGDLAKYISKSVIIGFTTGAAVLIAAGQLPAFLGFTTQRSDQDWPGLIGLFQRLASTLHETHWQAAGLGLLALALVLVCRKWSKLVPGPLIAVALTGLIVYFSGWKSSDFLLLPQLPTGFAPPVLPSLSNTEPLLAGAAALSVMGLLEAYAINKTLSSKTGTPVDANQELFSQSITNGLSSFLSCIPGSGSFSRSALNHFAGAQTMLSNVFHGLFVLLCFLTLGSLAKYVPMSAIAAILFVIAWNLIDWQYFKRVAGTSRADLAVCLVTLAATLTVPLEYAVFLGVILNLALYLRLASQLQASEMIDTGSGTFLERPLHKQANDKQIIFLQLEGNLFFALADELQDRLTHLAQDPVRVVVIRLKRTHSIDATALSVFEEFIQNMHSEHREVILCGVKEELYEKFVAFGLVDLIGRDNIFLVSEGVFTSAKAALVKAQALIGPIPNHPAAALLSERTAH